MAYNYFTKKFSLVNADTAEEVTIDFGDVLAYSIYPVTGEGNEAYIDLGECEKYFGIASAEKTKALIKDLVK